VDAIGGASARALVSFFTAYALAEGLDPEALLNEAWVERVTLPLVRSEASNAFLSFDELRERLPEVLDPDGPGKPDEDAIGFRQGRDIAMHIQLTGLRGLTYPIRGLRRDAPISATTYADWGRFRIEPGGGLEQMTNPDPPRSPSPWLLPPARAASRPSFSTAATTRRSTSAMASTSSRPRDTSGTRTAACSARSRWDA